MAALGMASCSGVARRMALIPFKKQRQIASKLHQK
jgi:hypothetical protein